MIKAYAVKKPKGRLERIEYDPGALGPDQVEIDIIACGLCHSDLSMVNNEWGNSVYGAEAASRYYFNHGAANLDAWEAARLAAMVPKPRYYDRNRKTPWLDRKTNLILGRMPSAQVP